MSDENNNLIDLLGVTPENLKVNYPHLYKDLVGNQKKVDGEFNTDFSGYNPNYKDFLARAETIEECLDIINYLEKQKEISSSLATKLRKLTNNEGPTVFGSRSTDYYMKVAMGKHT